MDPIDKTVALDRESFEVLRIIPDGPPLDSAAAGEHAGLRELPLREKLHAGSTGNRFIESELIGEGATAHVYSVRDVNCNREIAVKLLKPVPPAEYGESIERFISEASVVASLEHPSIIPVYDLDVDEDGSVYMSMRRVNGTTLRDYIRAVRDGESHPLIEDVNDLIQAFLKVCDALSFAHSKGHIHQDIKPDNIMIGEFGEVFVIDWGASSASNEELVLTPIYMSPQQAMGLVATAQDDVYCLGATLFHCLFGRFATDGETLPEIVEKKRRGVVRPPTAEEAADIAPQLVAIVEKALNADPTERYATIADFGQDLKQYQAGLAVQAYREGAPERFLRWYRSHAKVVWFTILLLLVTGIFCALQYREYLKGKSDWQLVMIEDFDQITAEKLEEDWQQYHSPDGWQAVPDPDEFYPDKGWQPRNGELLGHERHAYRDLTYGGSIPGDLRVEWDARFLHYNMDMNCFIGGEHRHDAYTFHISSFSIAGYIVLTKGYPYKTLDYCYAEPLESGRTYRLRMEIEDKTIRLFIDGKKVLEYWDYAAFSGPEHQTFGFDVCINSYTIDNVSVYTKPLPEKTSPLAVPDSFYQEDLFDKALMHYQSIRDTHPNTGLAAEALFGIANCHMQMKHWGTAVARFQQYIDEYPGTKLAPFARLQIAVIYMEQRDWSRAEQVLGELADTKPDDQLGKAALLQFGTRLEKSHEWSNSQFPDASDLPKINEIAPKIRYWATRFTVPTSNNTTLGSLGLRLNRLGMHHVVLREYKGQPEAQVTALRCSGRFEELLEQYPAFSNDHATALLCLGRHEDALAASPYYPRTALEALIQLGRFEEAMKRFPDRKPQIYKAMGRPEEILKCPDVRYDKNSWALIQLGREEEIVENGSPEYARFMSALALNRPDFVILEEIPLLLHAPARQVMASKALKQGRIEEVKPHLAELDILQKRHDYTRHWYYEGNDYAFDRFEFATFVRFVIGGQDQFRSRVEEDLNWLKDKLGNVPYTRIAYVAGKCDETMLKQEVPSIGVELELLRGMRAEVAGRPDDALEHYKSFRESLARDRLELFRFQDFLDWRIADLSE